MTAEQKYKDSFGIGTNKEKIESALQHALDIRKFEISLYWQRGTYFWTLIAVTFAGYFAVLSAEHMKEQAFNAYVIGCVGLIFSLAWFLTNRGSKYWQENWENHVDMLEDHVTGPLYKTVLHRPKTTSLMARAIEGPAPYSVSQINQWVSFFTIAVWLVLIFNILPPFGLNHQVSVKHCVLAIITVFAAILMLLRTRSNIVDGEKHSISVKRTGVIDGHDVRYILIKPYRSMQNGYIESFNDKFRDNCINDSVVVDAVKPDAQRPVWFPMKSAATTESSIFRRPDSPSDLIHVP